MENKGLLSKFEGLDTSICVNSLDKGKSMLNPVVPVVSELRGQEVSRVHRETKLKPTDVVIMDSTSVDEYLKAMEAVLDESLCLSPSTKERSLDEHLDDVRAKLSMHYQVPEPLLFGHPVSAQEAYEKGNKGS